MFIVFEDSYGSAPDACIEDPLEMRDQACYKTPKLYYLCPRPGLSCLPRPAQYTATASVMDNTVCEIFQHHLRSCNVHPAMLVSVAFCCIFRLPEEEKSTMFSYRLHQLEEWGCRKCWTRGSSSTNASLRSPVEAWGKHHEIIKFLSAFSHKL